jgi:GT2 family glycosyltransferase
MLLSIVIPSYGRANFVDAIWSCIRQNIPSHASLEIVLVDNTVEGKLRTIAEGLDDRVRWIHEPRPGISHARNSGVCASRGDFIIFLDDDELAPPTWAAALLKHAEAGSPAVFGPVLPSFAEPPGSLERPALRLFQRNLSVADGADITAHFPHLGTGNSLFSRSCFASDEPFPVKLNDFGGEDSAFIHSLVRRGARLTWSADAAVVERIPAERLTFADMAARHFRQGQIRSGVRFAAPGLGWAEGLLWMAIGVVQALLYGSLACALAIFAPHRAQLFALDAVSGLGKIFWQSSFRRLIYGTAVAKDDALAVPKPSPTDAPSVSILIVNYRTRELTLASLRSVVAETKKFTYEILLVDNSADVDLAKAVATEFPDVELIVPAENAGFARGNNIAAKGAKGDYLLLLNPDTVILDGAIDRLLDFAQARPGAKIWGGRTVFADGSLNHMSCWRRTTLWNVFCRTTGLTALFPNSPIFHSEAYGGWDRSSERQVDIVTGCFLLITRKFWETLGGFDEQFFMYGEEADLCLRARRLGARPAVTPKATIIHYGGATEQAAVEKNVMLMAAKAELIKRHWPSFKRPVGLLLFSLLPLSRAVAAEILDRIFGGGRSQVWWQLWRARRRWQSGYSENTRTATPKSA